MLPDMLTLLRAVLACILNLYISAYFGRLAVPTMLFLLIFLTDFLDGTIARRCGCTSKRGAILDILADFFYIVSSSIVLYLHNTIPVWFVIVVVLKFMEFLFTSRMLRHRSSGDSMFIFDFIGRYAAALFYGMPLLAYISFIAFPVSHNITIKIFCGGVSIISLMSSSCRFWCCCKHKTNRTIINFKDKLIASKQ
jgi:CDP-diacylglycerol--glycerol-3-phosphate 3-phosphatidyltransferase